MGHRVNIHDHGCVSEDGKNTWNAIGYAIELEYPDIVKILIDDGADVTMDCVVEKGVDKLSVFDFAMQRKKFSCIDALCGNYVFREQLKKVKALDFRNQKAELFPTWMKYLPDSVRLNVDGNPLSFVPSSVKKGGTKSILQYVKDMDDGGRLKWTKAKILVLGKEGTGKTTLYHCVRGDKKYSKNVSTNGVEIKGKDKV